MVLTLIYTSVLLFSLHSSIIIYQEENTVRVFVLDWVVLSVSLARRITSGPACLASVIASTHSTVFFSGPINREMRNLISSLKNHNEQLKGEISRYKRKLREASIELSKVCIQNCAKLSRIYLYSVLHCLRSPATYIPQQAVLSRKIVTAE